MSDATEPTNPYERPAVVRRDSIGTLLADATPSSDPAPDGAV